MLPASLPVSGAPGWRPAGPYSASVESIAFLTAGGETNRVLAVTSNAFLYESRNGGDGWTLIRFPAQHQSLAHALMPDPHRANAFVVGVSSPNSAMAGLYQTFDGGKTWRHTLSGVAVFSAAFSAADPQRIAAGARDGVYLSTDGGATWKRNSPVENKELQPVMSLGFDPRDAKVLYAGTPHLPWKTSDGGANWASIHHGMIDDSDILALTVNPKQPEQLFIGACSGIYRSDNSAQRWTKLLGITGAGFRTYAVAVDTNQPGMVYSGTRDGLWRSPDLGKTWRKLTPNIVKRVAVSPVDSKIVLLATEDAGVLRSRDGGETFHDASTGLADRRMIRMASTKGAVFVAMGRDASTHQGVLGKNNDIRWRRATTLPGANLVLTPTASGLYAQSAARMWRSTDGAATWKPLPVLPPTALGTAIAQQAPLAATPKAVYRLSNNGLAWQVGTPLAPAAGSIRRLLSTRSGVGPVWLETTSGVWTGGGTSPWVKAALPAAAMDIYELDASKSTVYAATAHGLYRSTDGGKSWIRCEKGIDAGSTTPAVAVHPQREREAYAVQYGRIFQTTDGGESWNEFPVEGLDGASIASLGFLEPGGSSSSGGGDGGQLIALTSARGVFVFDSGAVTAGTPQTGQ